MEPKELTYAISYFSEASEFNPYPTENQQTFHEHCRDVGWTLAAEWAQMQIFYAEQQNPTPIESEESVKLKGIHKAMKKNFLPSSIVLLLLALFQLVIQFFQIAQDPVYQLASGTTLLAVITWLGLVIYMLMNVTGYLVWYGKSKRAVDMGKTCVKSWGCYKEVSYFVLILVGIHLAAVARFMSSQGFGGLIFVGFINVILIFAIVYKIKNILKRAEVSRGINLTITIVSCVILSFLLTGVSAWGIIQGMDKGWFGKKPAATYTAVAQNGYTITWDIYQDALPLRVEDLQKVNYNHYSYKWTVRESLLLAQYTAQQNSFPDGQSAPRLSYEIVKVKLPLLYTLCLKDYLDMYFERDEPGMNIWRYQQTDDPAWRANEVYQLFYQEETIGEYILCFKDRIIHIRFDEVPTTEQIAIAVEKLSQ